MAIELGDGVPDVTLTIANGEPRALRALPLPLVVYFYPKDDTPGCTREAREFSQAMRDFAASGVSVVGISRDTPAKHARFAARHELTVPLATDVDGHVLEAFGVWIEKQLYGRSYMGIDRATFLFDRDGVLVKLWRKVRVAGHVEAVLAAATAHT